MNKLTIRNATFADVESIVPRLRSEDVLEAKRAGVTDLYENFRGAIRLGVFCWVVVDPFGVPQAIGGVSAGEGEAYVVWLMTTEELVTEYRREFLVRSRDVIREINKDYPLIWNNIDADNTLHLRWAAWLGFKLSRPMTRKDGHPFIMITRRNA